jgi:hypothetical protein
MLGYQWVLTSIAWGRGQGQEAKRGEAGGPHLTGIGQAMGALLLLGAPPGGPLIARGCLRRATPRGQSWPSAGALPQGRHGLSVLLAVFCASGVADICRQVQRQLLRNELARFYHYRTRKCIPPRKLRRDIQPRHTVGLD